MSDTFNSKHHRIAQVALIVCGCCAANAAPTTVDLRIEIEPPVGVALDRVHWGLLSGTIELASGELNTSTDDPTASGALAESVKIDRIDLQRSDTPMLYVCINNDPLRSHVASFGDVFQHVQPVRSESGWKALAKSDAWRVHKPASRDHVLIVHYHRFDKAYANASLWTWDEKQQRAPQQNELLPVGEDDFGLVFQLDASQYGQPDEGIGLLPRRNADWNQKDGGDRMWVPRLGREVYLVQNDNRVYPGRPDLRPTVRSVTLDAPNRITVRFSREVHSSDWPVSMFTVNTSDGSSVEVSRVFGNCQDAPTCPSLVVETKTELTFPSPQHVLNIEGQSPQTVRIGDIQKDSTRFFDPDAKLGATYAPSATVFRVFAPGASSARVVVANAVDGLEGIAEHAMQNARHGIWEATVAGDQDGKFYAYKLAGLGYDANKEITDVYATCTQGRHARARITNLAATDPPGFRDSTFTPPGVPTDAIIYEMHVRDFTIDPNSGVKHRGKFLGFIEAGTHLKGNSEIATGLDHLVELGVTHVQMMPIQDFDNSETADDAYNWGYMPVHFNSPDGWFASAATGPAKIREFKQLVQGLHARGIGVILDVVYNHTALGAPFETLAPGYYFRLDNKGHYSNGSGCGNEFSSESPMARKFILDSCRFWVEEYKIDGFRFDLMGLIDLDTMRELKRTLRQIHPQILVYGEPWTGGATTMPAVTDKHRVAGTGIGAFNDHFRDAIKGDRDGHSQGFIQSGNHAQGVAAGLKGAIDDWTQNPIDSINYFAAHDNLTVWDKLLISTPNATDAERRRMMRFAALILFTSQGSVFMHGGQELCRTKGGSHNSYNQPDAVNMIEWERKRQYADVLDYTRAMIAIRKAHAAFRLASAREVRTRVRIEHRPTGRCIVYRIDGQRLPKESANTLIVLLNGESEATEFELPSGEWFVHADADRASPKPIRTVEGKASLPARSGMLLMR